MSSALSETKSGKVNLYVDGFNLYHAIDALRQPTLKWLSLRELGRSYLKPGEALNRVIFFTAILTWEKEKQQRHKNYIKALRATGVEVVESNFRKVSKHCRIMNRNCSRHEEKQTDVAIAISLLAHARDNDFTRAILVTADSDQIPLIRELRHSYPEKAITLAAPPNRGGDARELGQLVHERKPITVERLRACLLPRDLHDDKGRLVASMPALYQGENSN